MITQVLRTLISLKNGTSESSLLGSGSGTGFGSGRVDEPGGALLTLRGTLAPYLAVRDAPLAQRHCMQHIYRALSSLTDCAGSALRVSGCAQYLVTAVVSMPCIT